MKNNNKKLQMKGKILNVNRIGVQLFNNIQILSHFDSNTTSLVFFYIPSSMHSAYCTCFLCRVRESSLFFSLSLFLSHLHCFLSSVEKSSLSLVFCTLRAFSFYCCLQCLLFTSFRFIVCLFILAWAKWILLVHWHSHRCIVFFLSLVFAIITRPSLCYFCHFSFLYFFLLNLFWNH